MTECDFLCISAGEFHLEMVKEIRPLLGNLLFKRIGHAPN